MGSRFCRADADSGTLTIAQARGQYLTGLLGCVDCHSPKLASGAIDTTKMFSGNEIMDAFRHGKDPESGADGGAPTYH
ncbi:MAG TPA: hypothetical protein VH374_09115 [Polyangia bacterium]|nr:hypothetical protein [Polyangia bacterium]